MLGLAVAGLAVVGLAVVGLAVVGLAVAVIDMESGNLGLPCCGCLLAVGCWFWGLLPPVGWGLLADDPAAGTLERVTLDGS